MKNILFALLFFTTFSCSADDWSTIDKQREVTYIAFHIMDWAQTRTIARNPNKWHETNSILGKHPSVDKVDAYFAVMALAHIAISNALPTEYRSTWQYISIGVEAGYVVHNLSLNVDIKF
jgi:hypothetical protein